jgi:hypothetical protein
MSHDARRVAGRRPSQLDDARRRRIEPEIELELTLTRRHHAAHDAAKRRTAGQPFVGLTHGREIGKGEKRVGVAAQHRPQQAALDQIADVILAQAAVARQQIA